jgi:hypothetical protein
MGLVNRGTGLGYDADWPSPSATKPLNNVPIPCVIYEAQSSTMPTACEWRVIGVTLPRESKENHSDER